MRSSAGVTCSCTASGLSPGCPGGALISRVGWGGVKSRNPVGCGGSVQRVFRDIRLVLPCQLSRAVRLNLVLFLGAESDELYTGPAVAYPPHTTDGLDGMGATGEAEAEEQVGANRGRGPLHREQHAAGPEVGHPPFPDAAPSQFVLHREVTGNAGRATSIDVVSHGSVLAVDHYPKARGCRELSLSSRLATIMPEGDRVWPLPQLAEYGPKQENNAANGSMCPCGHREVFSPFLRASEGICQMLGDMMQSAKAVPACPGFPSV